MGRREPWGRCTLRLCERANSLPEFCAVRGGGRREGALVPLCCRAWRRRLAKACLRRRCGEEAGAGRSRLGRPAASPHHRSRTATSPLPYTRTVTHRLPEPPPPPFPPSSRHGVSGGVVDDCWQRGGVIFQGALAMRGPQTVPFAAGLLHGEAASRRPVPCVSHGRLLSGAPHWLSCGGPSQFVLLSVFVFSALGGEH